MEKLIKIQNELKAPKNQYNSFGKYKYRNQEDILEALKPLLKDNECTLVISDEVKEVHNIIYIEATATFNDGKSNMIVKAQAGIDPNRKGMDISQSFGSSSSYARKYALNGLFLIDDTKDADATNQHDTPSKDDRKPALTLDGFKYLTTKGTKDEIQKALDSRRMTTQERNTLKLAIS
jgi:hypothetical protein